MVNQKIIDLLFGPETPHSPTPSNNSYSQIDRIEWETMKAISQNNPYTIVITAMGCSGRILQKRLWYQCSNIFLFDFGSLMDAICGWNTRAWIPLSGFDKDRFKKLLIDLL